MLLRESKIAGGAQDSHVNGIVPVRHGVATVHGLERELKLVGDSHMLRNNAHAIMNMIHVPGSRHGEVHENKKVDVPVVLIFEKNLPVRNQK